MAAVVLQASFSGACSSSVRFRLRRTAVSSGQSSSRAAPAGSSSHFSVTARYLLSFPSPPPSLPSFSTLGSASALTAPPGSTGVPQWTPAAFCTITWRAWTGLPTGATTGAPTSAEAEAGPACMLELFSLPVPHPPQTGGNGRRKSGSFSLMITPLGAGTRRLSSTSWSILRASAACCCCRRSRGHRRSTPRYCRCILPPATNRQALLVVGPAFCVAGIPL